jgi:hypothetical protein
MIFWAVLRVWLQSLKNANMSQTFFGGKVKKGLKKQRISL